MGKIFFVLVCTLASVWGVNCVSLSKNETVLTSYHPCDLAFIHFERINASNWIGNLNFGLYPNLKEAFLKVYFEKEVTITPIFNNLSISLKTNKKALELHSKPPVPKLYTFNVFTSSQNASIVPQVHNLTLNNEILCSSMKRNQALQSLNATKKINDSGRAYSCGRRSIKHAEIVSLRTEAKAGDWPWHVAVFIKLNGTFFYQCGGSIVSPNAVLTAAHCIAPGIPPKDYLVVAGISKVNKTGNEYYTMQNLTIVGFGKNERNVPNSDLRAIKITVQRDTTCSRLSEFLNNYTFCAGNGPNTITNVSSGDSGGGLVMRTSQPDHGITWFIRGVLSKCGKLSTLNMCDLKEYVVFTNVAAYYDWIYQNSGLANTSNTTA